ncbi:unnamed protein product, partial [Nesidiocoris tenuis]
MGQTAVVNSRLCESKNPTGHHQSSVAQTERLQENDSLSNRRHKFADHPRGSSTLPRRWSPDPHSRLLRTSPGNPIQIQEPLPPTTFY